MHADLVEVEQPVEQPHVPVRRSACTDVAEDLRIGPGEMARPERGERARPHVRDRGCIDDRPGHPGVRIEQVEQRHLRRKAELVVVDVVPDDLHASHVERGDVTPEHVEVTADLGTRTEVHAWFDHGLARSLGKQSAFDRVEDLLVGHRQSFDVETVEVCQMDFSHDGM